MDGWLFLADKLGMPLGECMRQHTERELRIWLAWHEDRLSKPDKVEWYLMQVAAEVRRVLSKKPANIKMDHFILRFGPKPTKAKPSKEQAAVMLAASKARTFGALGLGKRRRAQGLRKRG